MANLPVTSAKVRKRKDTGKYEVWYTYQLSNGQKVRKSQSINQYRIAADREANRLLKEGINYVSDITLNKMVESFFKDRSANIAYRTKERYATVFKKFISFFGEGFVLSALNYRKISEYKTFLLENNFSASTINLELKALQTLFNVAIDLDHLQENPIQPKKHFIPIKRTFEPFFDKEQIAILLRKAQTPVKTPGYTSEQIKLMAKLLYNLVYTYLKTGLRREELTSLKKNQIDFNRKKIAVLQKSAKERYIDFDENIEEIFQWEFSRYPKSKWVFHNSLGRQNLPGRVYDKIKRLYKRCGFSNWKELNVHTLRHTFVSHLVMGGVDLITVKNIAGHTSLQTTQKYAHLAPAHVKRGINTLNFF